MLPPTTGRLDNTFDGRVGGSRDSRDTRDRDRDRDRDRGSRDRDRGDRDRDRDRGYGDRDREYDRKRGPRGGDWDDHSNKRLKPNNAAGHQGMLGGPPPRRSSPKRTPPCPLDGFARTTSPRPAPAAPS